jgi:hypothetical protein
MQAEPVMEWDPIAKEMVRTGEWKFDASGATRCLEYMGDHLQLRKTAPTVGVQINLTDVKDEELDARLKAIEGRLKK